MINKVEIRDILTARMKVLLDLWVTQARPMECFMENGDEIDLSKVPDEFICFHIDWLATTQKNIAENPDHRYYGDVVIILFGKVGTGTRKRLGLEDEISEHFKFKMLSGVQLQQPTPSTASGRSEKHDGWHSMTVTFPFFADSNS